MSKHDAAYYKKKIFTIPNILSMVRLALIPVFIWLYSVEHEYVIAAIIFTVSSLTDIVDGFIARKFNMISDVGKILDPIADKLTQLSVLICLLFRFKLMWLPVSILVIKEVITGIMSIMRIKRTHKVHMAVWHGKLNTVLLYLMLALHLVWSNIPTFVSHMSITLCAIMMMVSAVLYGIQHVKAIKSNKKAAKKAKKEVQ